MNSPLDNRYPELPRELTIPRGSDGDPVFAEPWEARVFALVVAACNAGRFEWIEFQQLLIAEIKDSEQQAQPTSYYINWARAAEKLFESLGTLEVQAIDQRVAALRPDDKTVRLR